MSFPVAVQIYSVRDDAAKDFEGTLKKIKEMGYDGVEFAGLYDCSPEKVKKMCKDSGLVPISAHVPYYDMTADTNKVLSDYAEIGCKYVAIPYLTPECRPGTEGFADMVKNAAEIGKVAKGLGMQLLYHNHDFEFEKIDGKYALDLLYETVPADLLCTELDTCWVKVSGEDPAAYIRKYAGRSPVVHLKDFAGGKSDNMYELIGIESDNKKADTQKFEFRPVGSGCQDFPGILDACRDAETSWIVVEQDQSSMNLTPMESIDRSIKYLKTINI